MDELVAHGHGIDDDLPAALEHPDFRIQGRGMAHHLAVEVAELRQQFERRRERQRENDDVGMGSDIAGRDGTRIPARLLERAKGVAVLTVAKGGFGIAGVEFGTGLVIARLGDDQQWSAPYAIGTAGMSWGGESRSSIARPTSTASSS